MTANVFQEAECFTRQSTLYIQHPGDIFVRHKFAALHNNMRSQVKKITDVYVFCRLHSL